MSIVWSNQRVLELIELYRNCECLWDTAHNDFKDKIKKRDALDLISKQLDLPTKEVENKLHTLRSQFTREMRKFKLSKKNGSGNEAVVNIRWFAYEPLKFLLKGGTPSGYNETLLMEESISTEEEKQNDTYDAMIREKSLHEIDVTDEFDIYGKYVASELRNIKDEYSTLIVKKNINDILIDARIGRYREYNVYDYNAAHTSSLSASNHSSPHQTNVVDTIKSEPES